MPFVSSQLGSIGMTDANSSVYTGVGSGSWYNAGTPSTPGSASAGATSLGPTTASSVQAAQSIGFSTPSTVALPSWLSTDPNTLTKELQNEYSTAGQSILDAANKTAKKAGKAADMAYGQQMREGQEATAQQTAVNRQQGGTAATSSVVAGQMAEEAAKNRVDSRVQIAQMKLGATEQAASLSSQIAGQLASMRISYLGTLANTSTAMRGQDTSQTDFTQSQAQQAAEFGASLQATKSGGASGTGGAGMSMGYYGPPNSGSGVWYGANTLGG